jgi:hypothetical protein
MIAYFIILWVATAALNIKLYWKELKSIYENDLIGGEFFASVMLFLLVVSAPVFLARYLATHLMDLYLSQKALKIFNRLILEKGGVPQRRMSKALVELERLFTASDCDIISKEEYQRLKEKHK